MLRIPLRARFETRVYRTHSCWFWVGGTNKGYGMFYWNPSKPQMAAHRVAWLLYKGEIAGNLDVCHACDIPQCVNPEHLFLGTRSENLCDSVAKGRWRSGYPEGVCKRGHLMHRGVKGNSWCTLCSARRARDRYRKINRLSPSQYRVSPSKLGQVGRGGLGFRTAFLRTSGSWDSCRGH